MRVGWSAAVVALALSAVHPAGAQPVVSGYDVSVYSTLPGPVGLAFDAAGNLFVGSDVPEAPGITEQWIRRIPAGGGAAENYGPFPIPDPLGVFVDAAGELTSEPGSVIVSGPVDATSGQIVAIPPGAAAPQPGAMLEVLHDAGAGGVSTPSYLARGAGGLLIVDAAAKAILELPPLGAPTPLVTSTETPRYVATDASGTLFVSYDSAIRSYDSTGATLVDPLVSGLAGPLPIAVSPGGEFPAGLYAIEGGTGTLLRIHDDGTTEEIGSGFPENLGEMEFDAGGALYVASFSAGEVLRVGAPPPPPPLGPFLCYNARPAAGTPKPARDEVSVADALETREVRVGGAKALCSPAAVSASDIPVPVVNTGTAPLASYRSRWVPAAHHVPQTIAVTSALGTLSLETRPAGADRVMLPSGFHPSTTPAPVSNAGDPFQCYRTRLAPGAVFERREVTVADPLGAGGAAGRSLTLRKPARLCLAADYDGSTAATPDDLLLCYAAKPAKGAARSQVLAGMHVANARGADQQLDMKRGVTRTTLSKRSGRIAGDTFETVAAEGMTVPGEWDLEDSEGPRWSGGGPLGDGDALAASFGADAELPEGDVRRWRVFVEIDIVVNDTEEGPGVVMRSVGIPGIPDGTEIRAMAHGKPAGLRSSSDWFTPPAGTTLASLLAAEQVFEADGDGSSRAFAFQIKRFGIEYELVVSAGGAETGSPEAELCLPATSP